MNDAWRVVVRDRNSEEPRIGPEMSESLARSRYGSIRDLGFDAFVWVELQHRRTVRHYWSVVDWIGVKLVEV